MLFSVYIWSIGRLLLNLLKECTRYVGVDFSATALGSLSDTVEKLPPEQLGDIEIDLYQTEATNLAIIGEETFDTLVYNSVIQYFPDTNYVQHALEQGLTHLQKGGNVFIGDVRNAEMQHLLNISRLVFLLPHTTKLEQVHKKFQCLKKEDELLISPKFWHTLQVKHTSPMRAFTRPKMSHIQNELMKFRYDIVLTDKGSTLPHRQTALFWKNFGTYGLTQGMLTKLLFPYFTNPIQTCCLSISNIPDKRTHEERSIYKSIFTNSFLPSMTIATAREQAQYAQHHQDVGMCPTELHEIAQKLGVHVDVFLDYRDGVSLTALFYTQDTLRMNDAYV